MAFFRVFLRCSAQVPTYAHKHVLRMLLRCVSPHNKLHELLVVLRADEQVDDLLDGLLRRLAVEGLAHDVVSPLLLLGQ